MNLKKISFLTAFLLYPTMHALPQSILSAPSAGDSQDQMLEKFFSVFPNPATTYPSFTELDQAVTALFETTLELPPTLLQYIQRYYAYLKQQAAQECLNNSPSTTKGVSLAQAIQNAQEHLEQARHYNDKNDIQTWTTKLSELSQTANQAIATQVAADPITACRKTASWQNHLKVFIANSFTYEVQLLSSINQDEIKMFSSLPNFETAYYSTAYTNLRNSAEYIRMYLVLTDTLRTRALAQCTDWATITDPSELYTAIEIFKKSDFYTFSQSLDACFSNTTLTSLKSFELLPPTTATGSYSIAKGYRQYLTYTQDPTTKTVTVTAQTGLENLFSITNNQPSLTALGSFMLYEGTISPVKGDAYPGLIPTKNFPKLFTENQVGIGTVPTQLFIELLSFNALRMLNGLLNYLFNQENLADTLAKIEPITQKPGYELFPTLFFYHPEDQLLMEEINTLGNLTLSEPASTNGAQPAGFWSDVWDHIKDAFETMAHTLNKDFEKVGDDLWHIVKAAGNFFVHISRFVADVGIGLYYQTGISALVTGVTTGDFSYQGSKAAGYFDQAAGQIHDMGDNLITIVNSTADAADQVIDAAAQISLTVSGVAAADQSLSNDIAGMVDAVGNLTIGIMADSADFLIGVGASLVALAFEGVVLIEEAVVGVVMSAATGQNQFGNLQETGIYFAKDLIISILEAVTLFIDVFADALKQLMLALAYLTSAITEIVVQVGGAIMGLESLATGGSFWSGYHEVAEHTRLISAIVGLVLIAALTIVTLPAGPELTAGMIAMGVGMLVMGVGMSIINVIGANQQDMAALCQQENQVDFINTYSAYIKATIPAQQCLQATMLNEMALHLKEEENNADRDMVYYQNYMNNSLNVLRTTQAYQLSTFYNELVTPDTTHYPEQKILPADTGYSYGIQTNRFELQPATGFRVYNDQRQTFAQEIATTPAPFNTPTTNVSSNLTDALSSTDATPPNPHQHFITQKDLCNLPSNNTLSITIRWRIIYLTGGDFYIGIYLNQNYLDTSFLHQLHTLYEQAAQQRNGFNQQGFTQLSSALTTFNRYVYNFDNLAKAFVCYQNKQTGDIPALGIYEHSDLQFIGAPQQPPIPEHQSTWLKQGTWYRMTASLNQAGNMLSASFQEENASKIYWANTEGIQVTPLSNNQIIPYQAIAQKVPGLLLESFAGSFGVITSGAAVEYEIIYPAQTVTKSPTRTTSDTAVSQQLTQAGYTPLETKREALWIEQLEAQLTPIFNNITLKPFSDLTIIQGIYVYATTATGLTSKAGNPIPDYLITLANPPGASTITAVGQPLLDSDATLGQPFSATTSYCVSLVSGNCYSSGTSLTQPLITYPDTLAAYQSQVTLPSELLTAINQSRNALLVQEEGSFTFSNTIVTGIPATLQKGIGVYTCASSTQYLTGLDYLVFVNYVPGTPLGTAQLLEPWSSTNTINCALSLVTGLTFNVIAANGAQITTLPASGWNTLTLTPSGSGAFENTLSTYSLDAATTTAIQNQTTAYTKAKNKALATLLAQQNAPVIQLPPVTNQPITPANPTTTVGPSGPSFPVINGGNGGGFSFTG